MPSLQTNSTRTGPPPADRGVSASPKLAPPLQRVREGRKARPAFKFIKPLPRDLAVLEDPFLVDCFRHWGEKNKWRGLRNELDAAIFECMSTCVSRLSSRDSQPWNWHRGPAVPRNRAGCPRPRTGDTLRDCEIFFGGAIPFEEAAITGSVSTTGESLNETAA
jgi:hypothetical protein